jgi:hypothetical protein
MMKEVQKENREGGKDPSKHWVKHRTKRAKNLEKEAVGKTIKNSHNFIGILGFSRAA